MGPQHFKQLMQSMAAHKGGAQQAEGGQGEAGARGAQGAGEGAESSEFNMKAALQGTQPSVKVRGKGWAQVCVWHWG